MTLAVQPRNQKMRCVLLLLLRAHHVIAPNTFPPTATELVLAELLDGYGPTHVRPGLLTHSTDQIEVQIGIDMLDNIDQPNQLWSLNGYFRTWWTDPRLAFNATRGGLSPGEGIHLTIAQHALIWKPQLYLEDVVTWKGGLGASITIYPDGTVFQSLQMFAEMKCSVNLLSMPFDTQTCPLIMGEYQLFSHEANITWKAGRQAFGDWRSACPSGWKPSAHRFRNEIVVFPSGNYSFVYAELDLTRGNMYELVRGYVVTSVLLVFLSSLGFFINPLATPARVAERPQTFQSATRVAILPAETFSSMPRSQLGVITILTVLNNMISVEQMLPPGAGSTWLSDFLFFSFIFNACAFVEQVATKAICDCGCHHRQRSTIINAIHPHHCDHYA